MAFCPNCGSEAQGAFCPSCGTSIGGANPAPGAAPAQLEQHIVSALCYLAWPLTGILFLVLDPYKANREIRFHAFQSILVAAAIYAGWLALSFLAFMPFGIGLLFSMVTLAYPLAAFGIWLFLVIKAFNKEHFVVPILGPLAQSQA